MIISKDNNEEIKIEEDNKEDNKWIYTGI
jgi:hypothetical protein